MLFTLIALTLSVILFAGILISIEVGRRFGMARLTRDPDGLAKGIGASEGAVFGLMGLILAFTFSGAASRFEQRRHLITDEVNAIGTAFLRIEMVPEDARPELRSLFRQYVDLRLETYAHVDDQPATDAKLAETAVLQEEIWKKAVYAVQRPDVKGRPEGVVLPALNAMFDIVTSRKAASMNHPPVAIFLLMGALCLIASLLVGYGMSNNKRRSWLHAIVFAAVMSLCVYVILDLEFPRLGLIRVDSFDQLMLDVRKSMD
jgi:hypothetical protein